MLLDDDLVRGPEVNRQAPSTLRLLHHHDGRAKRRRRRGQHPIADHLLKQLKGRVVLLLRDRPRRYVRRRTLAALDLIREFNLELGGRAAPSARLGEVHLPQLSLLHQHPLDVSLALLQQLTLDPTDVKVVHDLVDIHIWY